MCTREATKCNLQEYIRISFTHCFRVRGTKVQGIFRVLGYQKVYYSSTYECLHVSSIPTTAEYL